MCDSKHLSSRRRNASKPGTRPSSHCFAAMAEAVCWSYKATGLILGQMHTKYYAGKGHAVSCQSADRPQVLLSSRKTTRVNKKNKSTQYGDPGVDLERMTCRSRVVGLRRSWGLGVCTVLLVFACTVPWFDTAEALGCSRVARREGRI